MPKTATQRLAEVHLGRSLDEFVAERRTAGDSWRTIAAALREASDLSVSHETLRAWYADATTQAVA
jgi:hypothetical protein